MVNRLELRLLYNGCFEVRTARILFGFEEQPPNGRRGNRVSILQWLQWLWSESPPVISCCPHWDRFSGGPLAASIWARMLVNFITNYNRNFYQEGAMRTKKWKTSIQISLQSVFAMWHLRILWGEFLSTIWWPVLYLKDNSFRNEVENLGRWCQQWKVIWCRSISPFIHQIQIYWVSAVDKAWQ